MYIKKKSSVHDVSLERLNVCWTAVQWELQVKLHMACLPLQNTACIVLIVVVVMAIVFKCSLFLFVLNKKKDHF